MAKRNILKLGFAILLFFLALNFSPLNEAIARGVFIVHCADTHSDYGSYSMVYGKFDRWGHYYDFSLPTPAGARPGTMGFIRVWVTWLGITFVGGFKGIPR